VEVARVEYRSIRGAESLHELNLWTVDKKTGELAPNPDAAAKMESALDATAEHVRHARDGEFPAAPAPSCGCPSYCHAIAICRVAGGPRLKSW
jgi:hypothetical protein